MAKTKSLIVNSQPDAPGGNALGRLRGALTDQEIVQFASFGIAATLPGMRYQWDQMGAQIRRMEFLLAGQQAAQAAPPAPAARIGRPPKTIAAVQRSGWSSDPEERKREMARRMAKRVMKKKPHGAVTRWNNATPAQRKRWLKSMHEGRRRKAEAPMVSLEQAS